MKTFEKNILFEKNHLSETPLKKVAKMKSFHRHYHNNRSYLYSILIAKHFTYIILSHITKQTSPPPYICENKIHWLSYMLWVSHLVSEGENWIHFYVTLKASTLIHSLYQCFPTFVTWWHTLKMIVFLRLTKVSWKGLEKIICIFFIS